MITEKLKLLFTDGSAEVRANSVSFLTKVRPILGD
jgi:hypothetical protein